MSNRDEIQRLQQDVELIADALLDFAPILAEDPVLASLRGVIATPYRADFALALRLRARVGIALDRSLSADQKRRLREALCDNEWIEKVRHEIAQRAAAEGWADFASLPEWFKEHWLQVLQILLALLPLFISHA